MWNSSPTFCFGEFPWWGQSLLGTKTCFRFRVMYFPKLSTTVPLLNVEQSCHLQTAAITTMYSWLQHPRLLCVIHECHCCKTKIPLCTFFKHMITVISCNTISGEALTLIFATLPSATDRIELSWVSQFMSVYRKRGNTQNGSYQTPISFSVSRSCLIHGATATCQTVLSVLWWEAIHQTPAVTLDGCCLVAGWGGNQLAEISHTLWGVRSQQGVSMCADWFNTSNELVPLGNSCTQSPGADTEVIQGRNLH